MLALVLVLGSACITLADCSDEPTKSNTGDILETDKARVASFLVPPELCLVRHLKRAAHVDEIPAEFISPPSHKWWQTDINIRVRFRMNSSTTVLALKARVLSLWPAGQPPSVTWWRPGLTERPKI